MSKKLQSAPSIEATLEEGDRDNVFLTRNQFMSNLKEQCQIRENALRTAQSLIQAYQKENQTLKEDNQTLKQSLEEAEHKLQTLQNEQSTIKQLQKSLLKYSQRINELLEKNMQSEQKIYTLEKEIERIRLEQQAEREEAKIKLRIRQREERQRRQVEGQFKNYLRIADSEDSFEESQKAQRISLGKNSLITAHSRRQDSQQRNQMKILEWKLKQKDQQVLILLKRLRDLQQKHQNMQKKYRRERIITSDSVDNYSLKKNNVSEFCN